MDIIDCTEYSDSDPVTMITEYRLFLSSHSLSGNMYPVKYQDIQSKMLWLELHSYHLIC